MSITRIFPKDSMFPPRPRFFMCWEYCCAVPPPPWPHSLGCTFSVSQACSRLQVGSCLNSLHPSGTPMMLLDFQCVVP